MTWHVVQMSGGMGSWATARRVADEHGTHNLTLLFADTLAEDPDLHRFLDQAAADIGVPVTRVCDGRTPEQVDVDRRWLSNARVAQCSLELKIKPCREWLEANCDPADTILYVGIDWTEMERIPGITRGWAPWTVRMPLCEPPYIDKRQIEAELRRREIEPPLLNRLGFPHNNCGGACVRGGQAQWAHLLRTFPDRFAAKEAHEERMRAQLGADVSILKDRTGGATRPLPLRLFRSRVEIQNAAQAAQGSLFDDLDWGGCGCLTSFEAVAA
ncbi:hypothetical protein [Catenuloplanes indicus]|uniref:Phosphoadenosine phosphosulphate reductase domain-containing protein n=1 Tax=Catenuloplanes indicus TaxID=137267 RepID=A0AAE4B2C7_9ACTN|nr:hypothetical protein [Catenuloplanes indicus]MDQ0371554.1 hypothetical protein [Catenuloplanes indicus]